MEIIKILKHYKLLNISNHVNDMSEIRSVLLCNGKPWGFRFYGGVDCRLPIRVSRVSFVLNYLNCCNPVCHGF